jgi:hypothetical protein
MASFGEMKGGVHAYTARHGGYVAATAGGSGDATEASGTWIDRLGYDTAKVVVVTRAVLGADETLSITAANLRDATSDAGASAADYGAAISTSQLIATGGSGGSTELDVIELFDVDLTGANRYVQLQFTPDLSRANTDTATLSVVWYLRNSHGQPSTAAVVTTREPVL